MLTFNQEYADVYGADLDYMVELEEEDFLRINVDEEWKSVEEMEAFKRQAAVEQAKTNAKIARDNIANAPGLQIRSAEVRDEILGEYVKQIGPRIEADLDKMLGGSSSSKKKGSKSSSTKKKTSEFGPQQALRDLYRNTLFCRSFTSKVLGEIEDAAIKQTIKTEKERGLNAPTSTKDAATAVSVNVDGITGTGHGVPLQKTKDDTIGETMIFDEDGIIFRCYKFAKTHST